MFKKLKEKIKQIRKKRVIRKREANIRDKERSYRCPLCKGLIHNETLDGWYLCNKCKRKFNPKMIEEGDII
jgi:ribosomal protein L37AE/L43A